MLLHDLPAEILQEIVASARQPDISNLLLTCRYIHDVTEPAFYRSIDNSSYGTITDAEQKKVTRPAFRLLLRTLLNRPELGNHVRRFELEGEPFRSTTPTRRMPQFTISDWDKLGARASSLGLFGDKADLDRAMANDMGGSWFPFLVSFFTKLQYFAASTNVNLVARSEIPSPPRRHHIPMVQSIADISSLVHVDIVIDDILDHPIAWNSPGIVSLFRLPRINSIRIGVGIGNGSKNYWPSDLLAPTLTKLCLFHTNLYEESIECILASTPNLYHLTLDLIWYDEPTIDLAGGFLDCRKIGEAIGSSVCSATLAQLSLDVKFEDKHNNTPPKFELSGKIGGPWESGRPPYIGPMFQWGTKGTFGSMKSLRRLTVLMTDPVLLFGWSPRHVRPLMDVLPDSLRGLILVTHLAGCREFAWKRDVMREWLRENMLEGQTGMLRRVIVRQGDLWTGANSMPECAEFESLCEQKGIDVKFGSW